MKVDRSTDPLVYVNLEENTDAKKQTMVNVFLVGTLLLLVALSCGGWYMMKGQQVNEIEATVGNGIVPSKSSASVFPANINNDIVTSETTDDVASEVAVGDSLIPWGSLGGCTSTTIVVNSKSWGSEIRWKILTHQQQDTGCFGRNGYPSHGTTTKTCCLPDFKYHLWCEDTYGDGWHHGSISVAGVNYCSDFHRGKFHQPIFSLANGKVKSTEPTGCMAYNRHECCGKKDKRSGYYYGQECVPHKDGIWPVHAIYATWGFKNECAPLNWIENNGVQSQKGDC